MGIFRDAVSSSSAGTGTPLTWTHTPVGTPKAVVVFINVGNNGGDVVTSVSYGGVSMTEVALSPNLLTASEIGGVHVFFLGSGVPTGAQTVSCVNTAGANKIGYSVSYTADRDCSVVSTNASINSTSQANPSSTLALSGNPCAVAMALHSGQGDFTNLTPLTNWIAEVQSDLGSNVEALFTYSVIGTGDVTVGWNQPADDALGFAVAIKENEVTVGPSTAMYRIQLSRY